MSSPIIFEKGTRDFSTLGLGLLSDAIQATTTEELNGQFIFEMDYPVSGNNADLIRENRIIVVNSGHILKRQGFIIRQIVRKIDLTMTVYAEHVSYATLDVALAPMGTISGDAKTALENWKRMLVPAVDFTVDSDILTTNSTKIGAPEFETARQGLGGHAGSILDVWGGEYQFDNWHIRLLKQRGKSANAIIAYGRNLISFEQDTNIADTYTSVYPYYQENSGDEGNKTHFLPERIVDSEFVGKYPNPKVLMLDLSNKFKDVADYSETKLRNYALSYIQSNNIGVPKVNMKISTVDLSRATGGFSEDIDLGDTVNVYFEKLGITTSAKVIKAVWNVLSDDYDKFEIGARRASLTESVSELATTADENANKALNQALVALQSADGKSTIYYLNSSDPWPTNPNENDTAFVKDGENSIMYRYMFNNDTGMFSWVKILDSMSADQIKQRVNDALESGKAYSDQLVADNVAQVNAVLDDVQAKQTELTAQQAELDTKAQGYADKALADAKADTLATATQTAKDASDALATAKTDLTTSLNKEVTDRANAVTALDTKAKGYADTAKNDAISASTTADGIINKKIDDTTSSITSTISQNKTDADGKITTAQSTATQALNGLATKVSQTVYDAKTGQLQTDLNTTTTTANQAKTDIVAIKSDNTKQDARMTTIESDANGTKTTVSNLQTDLGKANGSISTLQQRADGFDATVTKVNNLSVGGRNLLIGTKGYTFTNPAQWSNSGVVISDTHQGLTINQTNSTWGGPKYLISDLIRRGFVNTTDTFIMSTWIRNTSTTPIIIGFYYGNSAVTISPNYGVVATLPANSDWVRVASPLIRFTSLDVTTGAFRFEPKTATTGGYIQQAGLKLENGTMPTAWSPAPEDVDSVTAKAQLTADQATTSLNSFKTDANGRISKAQADIIVNANAITTKVSQSDYNAKTGDLTTKVNTAQSTADSATSMIGAYKTSNDARVASAESKITANANAITSKVSQTDYNTKTGQIDGQISTINQTAGQISQSVSNVKAQVDGLSVGGRNLLLHTNTNSYSTLNSGNGQYTTKYVPFDGGYKYQFTYTTASTNWAVYQFWGFVKEKYEPDTDYVLSFMANFSVPVTPSVLFANGASGNNFVQQKTTPTVPIGSDQRVVIQLHTNTTIPTASDQSLYMGNFQRGGAGTFTIWDLKIEKGNLASSYTPAPEDVDNKISTVSQTVDSISTIVSDPATGLSKRVQTAEGSISTVKSNVSDLQSKQTQTANGLTTEISNRATGDTNTLTQAKDFTTSSISNSESGMRSLITQTSDSIIAKVDTKTDSATVLSLLRDNWSIGIADNAGAITNGIVGNSTNMSLISNNVVINAPSTQIKGTAWINSAMIANGSIGTAQIGDASITSAKIMNLDVNKITGNVSNWVLSQWTSATGNKVTIDGNGLYFSPGTSRMTADGFEAWRFEEGHYAAMGLVGSYNWVSNSDMNGIGLIAKYYDRAHTSAGDPYRNEIWGADTIAIGGLQPEVGNGYGYIDPFMIFPANATIGERYFPGNGDDTIIMSRRLSIYTGLNMHGTAITNSSGYSLKENFKPISGTDALDIFDNTDFVSYDYIPLTDDIDEQATAERKNKVGFVINDNGQSPYKTDSRLIRYGNTRDDSVTVGYLMAAVKELHAKVKELTTKLEAQK